ncbi:hypothetical protein GDO78_006843 [Eleutherodactylus coqui]|uniref:Uncharacterized protein n=1 Tax=Eleutherodactylus coqui TaxID=57060 RepID=A0A8J6FGQ4_ELECQ|nr:hypothetical protein GDO78_006843 [Eleutherodactylus coqui]
MTNTVWQRQKNPQFLGQLFNTNFPYFGPRDNKDKHYSFLSFLQWSPKFLVPQEKLFKGILPTLLSQEDECRAGLWEMENKNN